MDNYYELLQISWQATPDEIMRALDQRTQHWAALVNHHQPEVAEDANRQLRQLEQARATLMDPAGRRAYDAQVSQGAIGPLADPTATGQGFGAPRLPPSPGLSGAAAYKPPSPTGQALLPADSWICPTCSTPNRPQSKFCSSCGTALSKFCPKCGHGNEVSVVFCSGCGTDINNYLEERQLEAHRADQLARERQQQQAFLTPIANATNTATAAVAVGILLSLTVGLCTSGLAVPVTGAVIAFGVWKGIEVGRMSQIPGDAAYRSRAQMMVVIGGLVLALMAVFVVLAVLGMIMSAISSAF